MYGFGFLPPSPITPLDWKELDIFYIIAENLL